MAYIFYKYSNKDLQQGKVDDLIRKFTVVCQNKSSSPLIEQNKRELLYLSDNSEFIQTNNFSVVSGAYTRLESNWHRLESKLPETFTMLLRSNQHSLIVNSDTLASRTIWYYHDNEQLIISTSQLFILASLGDFQLNNQALSWMISTGTTGPDISWDKRIKAIGPNGQLSFDKIDGRLQHENSYLEFSSEISSNEYLEAKMNEQLDHLFSSSLFSENSFVTLSGGVDSRVIASLLYKNFPDIPFSTYTWGMSDRVNHKKGDIAIAKQVAKKLDYPHTFLPTDTKNSELEFGHFLRSFALNSEARIDHYIGYLDGFKIWDYFSQKYQTNIRGDEVFGGRQRVTDEKIVRILQSLHGLNIYDNVSTLDAYDLEKIERIERLERRNDETLEDWRDRLFSYQNIPTVQASLNAIKQGYVEVVNPFLQDEVVKLTRLFSEKQRSQKLLFRQIFEKELLGLASASVGANGNKKRVLELKNAKTYIMDSINSHKMDNLIGSKLKHEILTKANLEYKEPSNNFRSKIRSITPTNLLSIYRSNVKKETIDFFQLSFRCCLVAAFKAEVDLLLKK